MKNTGWICPKCGRVYAPFIMECSHCNNNEIKPDPCIITPPWESDYSKYKSEVTTDTYRCGQNVTTTNGYFPELDEFNTNLDRSIHKYSSQEQLQESLDGLNKELENLGAQPTNLDELKDIKTIIEDIHRSEEITQDEIDIDYWLCTRCGNIHMVFPEDGCECGAPLEYLKYVI